MQVAGSGEEDVADLVAQWPHHVLYGRFPESHFPGKTYPGKKLYV